MTAVPPQTPAVHVSLVVHLSPSSHDVPFVFGVAWQLFVRPSETHLPVLQASFSALQSLSALQRTALTHSDGDELGDDDGYEQTSISDGVAPVGKSACFTQQCGCVSFVLQFVPLQTLPPPWVAAKGSSVVDVVHDDAAVIAVDPPQFNFLLLSHR